MFGSPVGKELELPLAQVVVGGLITATLLNLVVVPTVYFRVERRREQRQSVPTSAPTLLE
jgi:Cu/Ag efflux pump CusA